MIEYGLASWHEYVYIVCIDLVLKSLPHLFCKRGLARETVFTHACVSSSRIPNG